MKPYQPVHPDVHLVMILTSWIYQNKIYLLVIQIYSMNQVHIVLWEITKLLIVYIRRE